MKELKGKVPVTTGAASGRQQIAERPLTLQNYTRIISSRLQLQSPGPHLYGKTKREKRTAVSLPEAHRETRGYAWILRACAKN
jgi:hypothetical protein